MPISTKLLFESADGTTLFATDGTTVTQLANNASTPAFRTDPNYFALSATTLGSDAYIIMADTADGTSAIWQYNGTALTQITASSNYVYNNQDFDSTVTPQPLGTYNADLVFSQASLASNLAGDGAFDTATLALYNPNTGAITQPAVPNGGHDPHDFNTLNGTLYFEGTDSFTDSTAIYSYDGTTVTEIYNLAPSGAGSVAGSLIAFNGNLYFGSGGESVEELTSLTSLSNAATNVAGSAAYEFNPGTPATNLIVSNSHLFFDAENNGIYSLDTSNNLTQLIGSLGSQQYTPVVYNGALYWSSDDAGEDQQNLYSSTGTSASVVSSAFTGEDFVVVGTELFYNNNGINNNGTDNALGTINGSTLGTLAVPGGVGGEPLASVPAATAWAAASDPVTVTAGATATFHDGGAAVVLDPGLTLTDSASPTIASAAIVLNGSLVAGDTLNFTNQNGITGSYNPATWVLTLSGSATLANYQAALDSVTYSFSGDATSGGTAPSRIVDWAISDSLNNNSLAGISTLDVLCFCAGTLVATPDGEVRVEHLRAGDWVLTASNGPRQVRWIGVGKVLATRGKRGPETPVIVRRDALADHVPAQDLRVTKGHALWFDGVLIPVEELVNDRSILWDDHAQEVSLFHIELDSHDVLIANGAPAESYRDDGNRWLFHNANPGWHLPPQAPCAPVLTGGAIVDAVWRRLLERSGRRVTPPLTEDPDLHLLVDGQRIDAAARAGGLHIFRVPTARGAVRIMSRDAVPAQLGLVRDPRSLGVALRRIEVSQGSRLIRIDAADQRLRDGFHDYEPNDDYRWTNGDAAIPAATFAGMSGTVKVALDVARSARYPVLHEAKSRVAA